MRQLLLNYIKMLKAGFFHKTFLYSLLLIIPSVVKALFNVGSDYYEIPFVILVGFLIICIGINEISEKNYIFCLTLPMKTKEFVQIAYFHTYIIYIIGFLGTFLVSIFSHQQLHALYLLLIILFLLSTNFLYPILASSELKLKTDQQTGTAKWIILVLVSMIFIALFSNLETIEIGYATVFYYELLTIVIISIIVASTLKKSYKLTLKKVMGF